MLQMQILGNVGKDAEVIEHKGKQFMSVSLAHSEKYTDSQGNEVTKTEWVKVTSDRVGMAPHIKKGDKIFAQGYPRIEIFKNDKRGQWEYSVGLRATLIDFAGTTGPKSA